MSIKAVIKQAKLKNIHKKSKLQSVDVRRFYKEIQKSKIQKTIQTNTKKMKEKGLQQNKQYNLKNQTGRLNFLKEP